MLPARLFQLLNACNAQLLVELPGTPRTNLREMGQFEQSLRNLASEALIEGNRSRGDILPNCFLQRRTNPGQLPQSSFGNSTVDINLMLPQSAGSACVGLCLEGILSAELQEHSQLFQEFQKTAVHRAHTESYSTQLLRETQTVLQ